MRIVGVTLIFYGLGALLSAASWADTVTVCTTDESWDEARELKSRVHTNLYAQADLVEVADAARIGVGGDVRWLPKKLFAVGLTALAYQEIAIEESYEENNATDIRPFAGIHFASRGKRYCGSSLFYRQAHSHVIGLEPIFDLSEGLTGGNLVYSFDRLRNDGPDGNGRFALTARVGQQEKEWGGRLDLLATWGEGLGIMTGVYAGYYDALLLGVQLGVSL